MENAQFRNDKKQNERKRVNQLMDIERKDIEKMMTANMRKDEMRVKKQKKTRMGGSKMEQESKIAKEFD